jgi:hypothetical protein
MTLEEAKRLRHGQVVYHCFARNADGTPMRVRVTGQVKTWKRDPSKVRVPVKRGMYDSGYLDSFFQRNLDQWVLDEEWAKRGCAGKQPRKQQLPDLGRVGRRAPRRR